MACELATVQANACASGIGKVTSRVKLLQLTAQSAANWAQASNPGLEYTVAAIQERACASGIGKIWNRLKLLRIILQNLCGLSSAAAPVLFKANSATVFIQWTWPWTDPDHWSLEGSDDQIAWTEESTPAAASRQANGHHSWLYWRLIGQDASNNPVTAYSNILPDS